VIRDQRGAVYVETLIAYLPVLLFFFGVLQLADAYAAHLIVQRAAGAAARAAVVVMPDDEVFYGGEDGTPGDRKRADIERAADTVLRATRRLLADETNVELDREIAIVHEAGRLREPVTARVTAHYRCFVRVFCPWAGLVQLQAAATLPYQGARYRYPSEG
jgi:hypothetical protein